jgi:hypothetical protein
MEKVGLEIKSEPHMRYRYNRDEHGHPVATMVTKDIGDRIYFGISSCNPSDRVSKQYGKMIAEKRLEHALGLGDDCFRNPDLDSDLFFCSSNEMSGYCNNEHVLDLLNYFQSSFPKQR